MRKTIILLNLMLLILGASFAQNVATRFIESSAFSHAVMNDHTRAVIYSEGFEGTSGNALPAGWTTSADGVWITTNGPIPGVAEPYPEAHSGARFMARGWQSTGSQAWAFSAGFTLTAGTDYVISFWFRAPGYPGFDEYDDFEVRIGDTPTAGAMSSATLLFENITYRVNPWTLAELSFMPETTGTYYLGFHDLNPISGTGIFILIDDIEVSESPCSSVSNFSVAYSQDCEAQLTWTAPAGEGHTYQILRDNEEIATVSTTSYTDTDFEPTLEHIWTVKVICSDIYSVGKNVYKDACLETSCQRAKNLSVTYNEDCNEALLEWNAPAELLWDNTAGPSMYGYPSVYYMTDEYNSFLSADDFTVPAGETWYIYEVYASGSFDEFAPDFMGIKIFTDDNGKPGNQIYEQNNLTPLEGFPSAPNANSFMTLVFPEIFVIQSGKYWISYYGVYVNATYVLYYASMCTTPNGSLFHFLDVGYGEWEPYEDYPSLYFRVQGSKTATPIVYNIYRDGEPIQTNLTETFFADVDFNSASPHKWSVRVACPAGDQSPPIYRERENCLGCNPITNFSAEWKMEGEECVSVELNWVEPDGIENVKYTIKRGTTVIAENISGTSYIDTDADPNIVNNYAITFICDIITTSPVNATAPKCGVGINEVVVIDFTIRPNPAHNTITVFSETEINRIEIINFLGQTVISQPNNETNATVDISNLSSGIYFVRAISDEGANVKKFVKK